MAGDSRASATGRETLRNRITAPVAEEKLTLNPEIKARAYYAVKLSPRVFVIRFEIRSSIDDGTLWKLGE